MPDADASVNAAIAAIFQGLNQWGCAIVFASMFLDCLPFAAFVAPGVIMLVLAGFLAAAKSPAEALLLLAAAAIGVFTADTLMYVVGRAGYSHSQLIRRMVDKRAKLKNDVGSKGNFLLFLYQFPPYSRMFAPLVMGALELPWPRWLMLVSVSTALFVGSFFGLGWIAGLTGREAVGATKIASVVSTLFVFAFIVWLTGVGFRWIQARRALTTDR